MAKKSTDKKPTEKKSVDKKGDKGNKQKSSGDAGANDKSKARPQSFKFMFESQALVRFITYSTTCRNLR